MTIQEMIAKAQAEKERKQREQREAMERFKSSPMYQRMKEIMAEKVKEKAERRAT
jgi:hypothetical protein